MKYTIKQFFESKESLAIHTPEEWQAEKLCKAFDDKGYRWCNGESYNKRHYWSIHREDMCYTNNYKHSDKDWCEYKDCTILDFEQIDFEEKKMEKEFNYKYEYKRMMISLGGNGVCCTDVKCCDCPFHKTNFDDKQARCGVVYADECIEIVKKWAEENPENEREIDWSKVPFDTPVLVCASMRNIPTSKRYYAGSTVTVKGITQYICYNNGSDSTSALYTSSWENCKLNCEPKEEWYKVEY